MRKTLILSLFILAWTPMAHAAGTSPSDMLNQMSNFGGDAASAPEGNTTATQRQVSTSPVYLAGAPINLRSGGYINHSQDEQTRRYAAGMQGYTPPAAQTTAQMYNQSLVRARQSAQQNSANAIPSPFPPGFGER